MKDKAMLDVIQAGYALWDKRLKSQRADGTITLIQSQKIIIVDTGLPKDKEKILSTLQDFGQSPSDIDYVVCTHGDADHTSNNNLFPKAKLIVGFDIYEGDHATFILPHHT